MRQYSVSRLDLVAYNLGRRFDAATNERSGPQPNFFFTSNEIPLICSQLRRQLPQQVDEILAQAEQICRHRFDLLGYRNIEYGERIDWHCDAVHRKSGPRRPWFKIPYLDFSQVGDHKITWELNRHQHWVTLAKAYQLTGDQRFVGELLNQWRDWQKQNPYPIGINWASSLEVAFRSLSWLWAYYLLAGTSVLPAPFRGELLRALRVNARFIAHHLSTYFSPNTHLLGEAVALFFIGTLCPELPGAAKWQRRGWQIVLQEAVRQIQPDGLHFEKSTYYHVYALDFFLHSRILALRNGLPIPEEFSSVIEKMLDALCVLGRAGPVPQLGDDDGGRVFDPRRNRAAHLLDPLATGAVLFERGDFKSVADHFCEETLWLLGAQAAATFDHLPTRKIDSTSTALESSGLYFMSDRESSSQLVIDAGAQGAFSAGHGHADALSVTLSANGRPLLIDRGTFTYLGAESERDAFRGTSAHNTLQVDGLDQADPNGQFGWTHLPTVKTERWISGRDFDLFVGSHDGYQRSGVVHRRSVFHLKSNFWLIRDVVSGLSEHRLDLRFHLAPALMPDRTSNDTFVDENGSGLRIITTADRGWHQEVVLTSFAPAYGCEEPAHALLFSAATALPTEFVSLISLSCGKKPAAHKLSQFSTEDAVKAYRFEIDGEEHLLFFANQNHWRVGPWSSDAEFLYWSSSDHQSLQRLFLCNGTFVRFNDRAIIASPNPIDRCEVVCDAQRMRIIPASRAAIVNSSELASIYPGSVFVSTVPDSQEPCD
ncbi:MAG TPA: alginate lyase family protein [Terriglobales bacterium]